MDFDHFMRAKIVVGAMTHEVNFAATIRKMHRERGVGRVHAAAAMESAGDEYAGPRMRGLRHFDRGSRHVRFPSATR